MIAIGHQAALAVEDTSYYSAMVQAERLAAIGQTIATLSHHIKNILQGIRGGSYMIEMGLDDHEKSATDGETVPREKVVKAGDTIRRGWNIVEKNQEKISNLVLDMLTFSKQREPELTEADLNQVTADVVDLMRSRAAECDAALSWSPAAGMPTLTFDPEGIHRAVLNVITNAIDACADVDQRRVDVSTEYLASESLVRVVIADTGCGIAEEDLDKMFVLFESRKGSRGTGLGLPVSQKILREHGGQIVVHSQPGAGSRFVLEMPAVLPDAPAESPSETSDR